MIPIAQLLYIILVKRYLIYIVKVVLICLLGKTPRQIINIEVAMNSDWGSI